MGTTPAKYLAGLPSPRPEDFKTPEKTSEYMQELIRAIVWTFQNAAEETKKLIDG